MDYEANNYEPQSDEPLTWLSWEYYKRADDYPYESIFSTRLGTLPKKQLPLPLPAGLVHSRPQAEVHTKAAELQRLYPEQIWDVIAPTDWEGLFHYFDAYDTYMLGPKFLVDVLRYVVGRNEQAQKQMVEECKRAALEWILSNQRMVVDIPFEQDLISYVHPMELYGLKPRELSMFSEALQNEHATFLDRAIRDNEATANILSHGTLPPQGPLSQIYDTGVLGPGVVPMTAHLPPAMQHVRLSNYSYQPNLHELAYNAMSRRMSNEQSRKSSAHQQRRTSTDARGVRGRRNSNANKQGGSQMVSMLRRYFSTPHDPKTMAHKSQHLLSRDSDLVSVHMPPQQHIGVIPGGFVFPQNMPFPIGQAPPHLQQLAQDVPPPPPLTNPATHVRFDSTHRTLPPQDARMLPHSDSPTIPRHMSYHLDRTRPASGSHRMVSASLINNGNLPRSSFSLPVGSNDLREVSQPFPPFQNISMPQVALPGQLGVFDMRAVQVGHEYRGQNGSRTLRFNGKTIQENRDESGECTMLLKYVSERFTFSLGLKYLLDQIGALCNITWQADTRPDGKGRAYVHFESRDMTARAIGFFQNFLPPDGPLTQVMFAPQKRTAPSNYDPGHQFFNARTPSSYTAGHQRSSTQDRHRSRRQSVNNQSQTYRPLQYCTEISRQHSPDQATALTDGFNRQLPPVHFLIPRTDNQQTTSARSNTEKSDQKRNVEISHASKSSENTAHQSEGNCGMPMKVALSPSGGLSEAANVRTSPNKKENIPPYGHRKVTLPRNNKIFRKPATETTAEEQEGDVKNSTDADIPKSAQVVQMGNPRKSHNGQHKRHSRTPKSSTSGKITAPSSFEHATDMSKSMNTGSASSFTSSELVVNEDSGQNSMKDNKTELERERSQNTAITITTEETAKGLNSCPPSVSKPRHKDKKYTNKSSVNSLEQKKANESAHALGVVKLAKSSGGEDSMTSSTKTLINAKYETSSVPSRLRDTTIVINVAPKLDDTNEFPTLGRSKSSVSLIADGKRPDPPKISTPTNGSPIRKSRPNKVGNSKKLARLVDKRV